MVNFETREIFLRQCSTSLPQNADNHQSSSDTKEIILSLNDEVVNFDVGFVFGFWNIQFVDPGWVLLRKGGKKATLLYGKKLNSIYFYEREARKQHYYMVRN